MKNGLAIWHYPHRTVLENVRHFALCGFDAVSLHGHQMLSVCREEESSSELARLVLEYRLILTVHFALPESHERAHVDAFFAFIDAVSDWQKTYGCLAVLSFDVPEGIRDDVSRYIDCALSRTEGCRIAVEDFGLTEGERAQLVRYKGNARFGYLLDIGHLYIRMRGKCHSPLTLFANSKSECPVVNAPSRDDFLTALRSKEFPVFEIHLHGNDGEDDLHLFLEDGSLPTENAIEALKEFGFDGILTIESAPGYRFPCAYPESDRRIEESLAYLRRLKSSFERDITQKSI